jgi:ribonucleoside-diphosphate reductase beta chain
MNAREQALVRRALALFMGGEAAVTHDLSPLMIALKREGGRLEEEMFVATQLFEEAKHVEFFDTALRATAGMSAPADGLAGPAYTALFSELTTALDALLTDGSKAAQARAISSYHMCIEGVLAETGYYGIFTALRVNGLMPGITRGLELVQRDEARHIAFGLHVLTRLIAEESALWGVINDQLNRLLPLAQGVFMEVLGEFLPDIPFGLDLNAMVGYAGEQFMARVNVLERARQRMA